MPYPWAFYNNGGDGGISLGTISWFLRSTPNGSTMLHLSRLVVVTCHHFMVHARHSLALNLRYHSVSITHSEPPYRVFCIPCASIIIKYTVGAFYNNGGDGGI